MHSIPKFCSMIYGVIIMTVDVFFVIFINLRGKRVLNAYIFFNYNYSIYMYFFNDKIMNFLCRLILLNSYNKNCIN